MNKKYFNQLINTLSGIQDKKVLKNFLEGLLTEKEVEELSARLQIVKLLRKNIPQREIAEKLGVGIATITRGSKELQEGKFKNVQI
jgi:Trp operon repressor